MKGVANDPFPIVPEGPPADTPRGRRAGACASSAMAAELLKPYGSCTFQITRPTLSAGEACFLRKEPDKKATGSRWPIPLDGIDAATGSANLQFLQMLQLLRSTRLALSFPT